MSDFAAERQSLPVRSGSLGNAGQKRRARLVPAPRPTARGKGLMMGDSDEGVAAADAFVFFGATGDLAYKMIFPALYQMVKRERWAFP